MDVTTHNQTGRVNWTNGPESTETGELVCPDCGPKLASEFMWVRGYPSVRCMACMQKRETARKKHMHKQKRLAAALDDSIEG
jgi:uncharacterized Zn finger protein